MSNDDLLDVSVLVVVLVFGREFHANVDCVLLVVSSVAF